jgi:hypothetical protein
MKRFGAVLLGMLLAGAISWPGLTQAAGTEDMKLRVGEAAPDFKLQYFDGKDLKDVHLSDYRGKKNVVLAFYEKLPAEPSKAGSGRHPGPGCEYG